MNTRRTRAVLYWMDPVRDDKPPNPSGWGQAALPEPGGLERPTRHPDVVARRKGEGMGRGYELIHRTAVGQHPVNDCGGGIYCCDCGRQFKHEEIFPLPG